MICIYNRFLEVYLQTCQVIYFLTLSLFLLMWNLSYQAQSDLMKQLFKVIFSLLLSAALITPLVISTQHWHTALFLYVILVLVYFYNYYKTHKPRAAFVLATLCSTYLSIGLWAISRIRLVANLESNFIFPISFYLTFIVIAYFILKLRHSHKKMIGLVASCFLALTGFVLIVLLMENTSEQVWLKISLGTFLGYFVGSIAGLVFELYFRVYFGFFTALTDYLRVLVKPFVIFFFGYVTIAIIFAGIYNVIYLQDPSALAIPSGQIAFTDLMIYALDTMTTGGNSAVNSVSQLSQAVSSINVFSSIIWMTIMLAATIAYSAEHFPEISKKHRESQGKKTDETDKDNSTTI